MSDFIKSIWPRSLSTWLGLILGGMSLVKLIEHGFNYGYGPAFVLILAYYETLIHSLIGWWAEPIIRTWLVDVSKYVGWDLQLYPHWKHIFLLCGIYFFRDASTYLATQNKYTAVFHFVLGAALALLAAIGAGVIPLNSSDPYSNFQIAALPIIGIGAYEVGSDAWMVTFWPRREGRSWARAFIGRVAEDLLVIAIALAFTISTVTQLILPSGWSSGLLSLAIVVIGLAIFELVIAARRVWRSKSESPWADFWRQGNTQVGLARLSVFFVAALLVAANAGLRFYGL